ncbi:hypothetical protein A2480_03635 [Candidatus Uhrbacteria bacterium RIFOXYC2_FULL_47_19]|uniref:Uncharacterized protein n=1 Tax=Candidatus Uhrbacteria bacterium RIFOXYC2_FULL_47_19 TaxID=1802424 RepID=A0A1F7WBI1_9BACT|nr:MAG: hypothetical protein A2480_03635 [Candidatus Uhrbacteria bacterium RIFOXYC2_FULL_47_19]
MSEYSESNSIRDPEARKIGIGFWIPDRPRSARPSGMTAGKTHNFRDDKLERMSDKKARNFRDDKIKSKDDKLNESPR